MTVAPGPSPPRPSDLQPEPRSGGATGLATAAAALFGFLLFQVTEALTWRAIGAPPMFTHAIYPPVVIFCVIAAGGAVFLLRDRMAEDVRLPAGVLAFGLFLAAAQQGGIVLDHRENQRLGEAPLLVERIDMPGWRVDAPATPLVLVTGPDWTTQMHVPEAVAAHWRPGRTCLHVVAMRGRHNTTFPTVVRSFAVTGAGGRALPRGEALARCFAG